jgi:predicted neutral ceramidase superfamily lipid hydrolase
VSIGPFSAHDEIMKMVYAAPLYSDDSIILPDEQLNNHVETYNVDCQNCFFGTRKDIMLQNISSVYLLVDFEALTQKMRSVMPLVQIAFTT